MGGLHGFIAELVDLVQHVGEVLLRVNAAALDTGHDFADDLLARGSPGAGLEGFEIGQKVFVDELPDAFLGVPPQWGVGRGPVAPAIRGLEGGGERKAQRVGFVGLVGLALVKDAEEQDPRELGNVVHGAGDVRPAHDVADGFDGGVERLLGGVALAVAFGGRVVVGFAGHVSVKRDA